MVPASLVQVLDAPRHSGVTLRRHLSVFSFYLLLAVLYTYPLAFNLSTHIPDKHAVLNIDSDASLQTWYPWWVRKALLDPAESVLFTDWVFYPVGMELTMQPAMILHGAMTVPLWWMEITTANNVIILVSFALSGLAAYLLALYVCKSHRAALFGGFVFAFCPYKLQHLEGHIQLMATETLPLVALSLIRMYDRPSRRHLAWAGIWLGLTVYTDYYYFAYALLMTSVISLYRLTTGPERLTVARNTALSGVMAFLVAAPLLVPALESAGRSDYAIVGGHERHKADLLSPFIPSERQWFAQPLVPYLKQYVNYDRVDGIEQAIYVGWAIILLCGASFGRVWFAGRSRRLAVLLAVGFLILALGPTLRINGYDTFEEWRIFLPGYLLPKLPVFEGARATARIFIISALGLSVWSACALTRLLRPRRVAGIRGPLLAATVVGITAIEYIIPTGVSDVRPPEWVTEIAEDPAPGMVVHLPISPARPAFWQPLTERKMLSVSLGRTDPELFAYYWRHDALRFLNFPQGLIDFPTKADAEYTLNLLGIRYIIVDRIAYDDARYARIASILRTTYGLDRTYQDEETAVFRYPGGRTPYRALELSVGETRSELHFPSGWSNRKAHGNEIVSWMTRNNSYLALPPMARAHYDLGLTLVVVGTDSVGIRFGSTEAWLSDKRLARDVNTSKSQRNGLGKTKPIWSS